MPIEWNEGELARYLARVGYAGPRTATLATFQALVFQHATTIPFENLNPLLGWPVSLEPGDVARKLVHEGRGGYCFEHNLLFSLVLRALGFRVRHLGGRVLWGQPEDAQRPRTHMVLLVEVEGQPYHVDVGFGGMTPTAPLRFEPDRVQATPHEPYRLREHEGEWFLQTQVAGEWRTMYRYDLHPQLPADYEVANFYVSHHPASHFVTTLGVARATPTGRFTLRDAELTRYEGGTLVERRTLPTVAELRAALTDLFLLTLPESPALDDALHAAIQRVPAPVPA